MTSKRLYYILIVFLLILGGLTVASVYFGNQLLQKKTDELTELKVESLAIEEQQRSLVQAKKDIQTYSELESIAKTIVPQEKDQARTVREIVNLAALSGIGISSISFPSSDLGDEASKTPGNTQVEPVTGINGLYQMDISVQSDTNNPVSYQNFLDFLGKLEQNRRTAQVTSLNVQPTTENRNMVTFNLILRVYIKP